MTLSHEYVATPDPPPTGVRNPIHDTDGADAAGYAGALVAGVRTYGWAALTLQEALGDAWLGDGWVDFTLRRPLYAAEPLTVEVAAQDGEWQFKGLAGERGEVRCVVDGEAGLGRATWFGTLNPPGDEGFVEKTAGGDVLPAYGLDNVPLHQPLAPLSAYVTVSAARNMVVEDLGVDAGFYRVDDGQPQPVHPYFLAGRVAPLTRHNFTYGPTIHVRSQIQHIKPAIAERAFTVGGQIVDAYDRKGHWYQVLDCSVRDDEGEVARIRHHTIFSPRGLPRTG